MDVLYTCHRFWPSVGGTEQVVMDLARGMRRRGHQVTVATSDEPGSPAREEGPDGIQIVRFPMRRAGKFRLPPAGYVRFVSRGAWDVVHLHGQRVWSTDYLLPFLGRSPAAKVFTAHGLYQWHMHPRTLAERAYYRHLGRMLGKCDAIVALTELETRDLHDIGAPPERVRVIPDGVDVAEMARASPGDFRARHGVAARHVLLYVGGLYANKRVEWLVEAMGRVAADAELLVVGRDPAGLEEALRRQANAAGARVRLLGPLPREEVRQAFAAADVFLLPSRFEGFGIVLLEAMAAGVPFVATAAGAAPELAATGAGMLVGSPQEMAARVDDLLADRARREAMAAAGREAVHRYASEHVAQRHAALYADLARRR